MRTFTIGNWEVSEEGILWDNNDKEYFIEKKGLLELGYGERENMYDWLIHITTRGWLKREDIYAFNTAFVFAAGLYKLKFNTKCFTDSIMEQERLLNICEFH